MSLVWSYWYLYLNGVNVDSQSWSAGTVSTGDVAIGKWYGANHYSTYYGYNGEISKVRLYNRVLTAAEVKNAYSGQAVPYQYTKGKTNYTSDFSSDVDGWLWSYGATVADSSNTGGQTNNLKYTTNTGNYYKRTYYNSNYAYSTTDSHKARISFNIYIPSGNSHLVGYRVYMGGWLRAQKYNEYDQCNQCNKYHDTIIIIIII